MSESFEDHDSPPPQADTVRVAVRVRPLNAREKSISTSARFSWKVDSSSLAQCDNGKVLQQNIYTFDNVFQHNSTNSQIFDSIAAPLVKSTVDGMNGVIFAYGQTAAGKTYTMLGTEHDPGVTRRALAHVFEHVQQQTNRQFLLRASYIEIYNEVIRDLLVPGSENLKIHEDVFNKRVFVDAKEEVVMSVDQVMNIIATGEKAREVGETNMNERSSRSHTIFSLKIESREMDPESDQEDNVLHNNGIALRSSTLSLVDLAGSERASFTKAQGQRLVEGGYINKSLLTLGTVINKLSSGVTLSSGHIPYRDSKLTRLLQPALGGNARTSIVCAVTPAVLHMDETISTLKFASRAKKVTNMAKANEYLDDRAKLRKAEKKIAAMRAELDILRANGRSSNCSSSSSYITGKDFPSIRLSEGERVHAFEKMWNRILDKIPPQEIKEARSNGNRLPPVKDYTRPSLTSALDLYTGRVSQSSDGSRDNVVDDDEMAELRKKVMNAEKAKRRAFSEIEYERQAMSDEVQLLVAGSEEATVGRIAAEQDCERAMSMLAKAQSRSLVDEIVTHAMTKSEISKGLRTAHRKLIVMDKMRKENQTFKETLAGLRKEHADVMRREKRGIGPVLKEAKLAQNKAVDLENKLRSVRQSNQKLSSERVSLERDLKDRDRKIKVLTSEVERHRKHNERVNHRIKEEVAEEKKKFDSVRDKIKAELSMEQQKVEKLEKELGDAQVKMESLLSQDRKAKAELATTTSEIQKLHEDLFQKENESKQILKASEAQSSQLEQVQGRLREVEKDRDSLESYRAKLEEENVRKGDDIAKKVEELGRAHLELEETHSVLEGVRNDRENTKAHERSLRLRLEEAESRHNTALESVQELQSKLEERDQSLQMTQEKKQALEVRLQKLEGVENSLTAAEEVKKKLSLQLSEQESYKDAAEKRIVHVEKLLGERSQDMEGLQNRLDRSEEERHHLESEADTTKNRHDQLLRIVEELERANAELIKKDCETCVQLRKRLSATEKADVNGGAEVHQELSKLEDQTTKLNILVEQLTAETATRMREMLRLSRTLQKRDDQLHSTERRLDDVMRGEGIVAKLEERVVRRDMQIGALNRQLKAQMEVLNNGGLSERFPDAQRVCGIESENESLRESNQGLKERIRSMESEREEIREETFKLRDKIKEKDCRRIETAIARKEDRLKDLQVGKRRSNALKEVSENQVGHTK